MFEETITGKFARKYGMNKTREIKKEEVDPSNLVFAYIS